MRIAKSFTIDPEVTEYIDTTKGEQSASERINQLLKLAIEKEKNDRLEAEAAAFFSRQSGLGDEEGQAFRKASLRTLEQD